MTNILGGNGNIAQMDDDDVNFFAILYLHTINTRYFDRPLSYIANSYIILESALDMSDSNFLLHFRMEKDSFRMLVEEVKDYQEFLPIQGRHSSLYRKKAPVTSQLLVFLYVCGASGSDANYKKVASRFAISHGLVQIFVDRCTRAIIRTLQ